MSAIAANRRARPALIWIGLGVSGLFAYLAVRDVRFGAFWTALRTSDYWWLLPAFLVLALTILVKAARWRYLFAAETRPPLGATVRALLVGYFFNNVLPARAGEAARIVALNRRAGTSRAEIAATVVIERAYDVLSLLVLLFVAVPWLPHVTWVRAAAALGIALTGVLAATAIVLAAFGERPLRFALRPLARLLGAERADVAAGNLGQGLAALRRPRLVVAALFWTTGAWLLLALSSWLVLRGFGLRLSIAAGLLVVIATNLAQILPSSPAAVGVFEKATLVALGAYGVSDSRALSYAVVLHVLNFVPFVVVGLGVLHREAAGVRGLRAASP